MMLSKTLIPRFAGKISMFISSGSFKFIFSRHCFKSLLFLFYEIDNSNSDFLLKYFSVSNFDLYIINYCQS